jgi:hypothetical protein
MTIIGHFRSFGSSTLVGDQLISSADDPGTPVHMPSSRNINERIGPGGSLRGLRLAQVGF